MNVKAISRNVGYALLVSALFMLLSVGVSLINGKDSAFSALLVSFLLTFTVGVFPFIFVRGTAPITLKEGYVIIVLSWLLSFIFGMLPYMLWGGPFTLENAWFESVSGFTTTGATILSDVESLPDSLLFWRSSTHFIGGLGVVVFLLLLIPNASPIRMRLTNMELSSLSKDEYSARSNKTIYIFSSVYISIFILALGSYLLCGLRPIDAVCHAFSVCATGGFSSRNLSIASFGSFPVELVTVIFMILASVHFGLLFLTVVKRSLKPLNNPVLKFYLLSLAVFSLATGFVLNRGGGYDTVWDALWSGTFQTVSVASTTGFAITDNSSWSLAANYLLMFMAIMCGCAGSTTGGIKADRVLVLFRSIGRQISRILHPNSVGEVKLGNRIVRDDQVTSQLVYIALYLVTIMFSILLALCIGVNAHSSIAASVASVGNVGPAISELGFMGNYGSLGAGAKLLFSFDMFLGRIEIYPFLAVVAMLFEVRRRNV